MTVRPHIEIADILYFKGTKKLFATITNTAVVDNGDGTVEIETDTHGFVATVAKPIMMEIEGTTNYDGVRLVVGAPTTTTLTIKAHYVAEDPAGTETISFNIEPKRPFEFAGIEITLSSAPTTDEDITIDLDALQGSSWDINVRTKSLLGLTSWSWRIATDDREPRVRGDRLRFAYTNTDGRTLGIKTRHTPLS